MTKVNQSKSDECDEERQLLTQLATAMLLMMIMIIVTKWTVMDHHPIKRNCCGTGADNESPEM